jgi:predicted Rossmann fold nucleotide-binding protein DprA/Smf involved in DNA uptake
VAWSLGVLVVVASGSLITARLVAEQGREGEVVPAKVDHSLLLLLHAAPHTSEALASASGWALPKVLAALTELEMDGRAVCESGRWFARVI